MEVSIFYWRRRHFSYPECLLCWCHVFVIFALKMPQQLNISVVCPLQKAILMGLANQKVKSHDILEQTNFKKFKVDMVNFSEQLFPSSVPFLYKVSPSRTWATTLWSHQVWCGLSTTLSSSHLKVYPIVVTSQGSVQPDVWWMDQSTSWIVCSGGCVCSWMLTSSLTVHVYYGYIVCIWRGCVLLCHLMCFLECQRQNSPMGDNKG